MSVSSLLAVSLLAVANAEDFVQKATRLYKDQKELQALYGQHHVAHKNNERSELDVLLKDMHEYVVENEDEKAPKHIVTILTDDQGWADIGYNDDTFVTPTSDFLADKGSKLNNFYVQSTCSPTRASLLTGRYVTQTGIQDGAIIPGESRHLDQNLRTSGQYFQDAGYSTYLVGKWHLGGRLLSQTPNERGFDYFFGILGGAVDYYEKDIGFGCGSEENNFLSVFGDNCRLVNAYDFQENGKPYVDEVDQYVTDMLAERVVDTIIAHDANQPMLLNYHPSGPHTPLQSTPEMFEICSGVSEAPDALQPFYRQHICGMMASVDLSILRTLLALASKRMLANSLIVYLSDNGGFIQAGSSNGPFRAQKGSLFEGGIHVPAFMFGNGLHQGSSIQPVRTDLMHASDVLPTLLGYAGIPTPDGSNFDGYNFWPGLSKGLPLQRLHVPVNSASKSVGYFSAFIQNIFGTTWKYLLNPSVLEFVATTDLANGSYVPEGEFLFNLSEDPSEQNNLAGDSSLQVIAVLNFLRARTLLLQATSVPSQMTVLPPPIDTPPSILGCWLPLDSPYYATATCPVPTPVYPDFQQIMVDGLYNKYITANLDL